MRARVFVTLKPSVFDPQGTTVGEALHTLGYTSVKDVREGKYFELELDAASFFNERALALAQQAGVSYDAAVQDKALIDWFRDAARTSRA